MSHPKFNKDVTDSKKEKVKDEADKWREEEQKKQKAKPNFRLDFSKIGSAHQEHDASTNAPRKKKEESDDSSIVNAGKSIVKGGGKF